MPLLGLAAAVTLALAGQACYAAAPERPVENARGCAAPGDRIDIRDCGAHVDYKAFQDGAVGAGSTAFHSGKAMFGADDTGKRIHVDGAGPGSAVLTARIVRVMGAHDVALSRTASLNVSGAFWGYGSDDSRAWTAAVEEQQRRAAMGVFTCVYLPPGASLIVKAPPMFRRAGCIVGAGHRESIVKIDPELSGDLFTWSENWFQGNWGRDTTA